MLVQYHPYGQAYARGKVFDKHNFSVVPRERHCGIPAMLPPLSLKNAPKAGLRGHLENMLIFFSLFITISIFSVT